MNVKINFKNGAFKTVSIKDYLDNWLLNMTTELHLLLFGMKMQYRQKRILELIYLETSTQ